MKKSGIPSILFLLAVVFVCSEAVAQKTKTLTLDQATGIALEQNLQVAQALNNIESAQSGVLAAYGSYLPRLSASSGWGRSGSETGPTTQSIGGVAFDVPGSTRWTSNYSANITAFYTLFDGFGREARFNSAKSNEAQVEQSYVRTKQQIVYSVQNSYLNVLKFEQQVKVTEENLNKDKKLLERITEQHRVGALPIGDLYRQQSAVAQDEYNLIAAQNTYNKAKADLLSLIGVDVNEEYTIVDPSIAGQLTQVQSDPPVQSLGSFDDLRRRAFESRPDYSNATEAVRAAEHGITSAWSRYYPSVGANTSFSSGANEFSQLGKNKNYNLGLSVSWTLFDGFTTNQQIQSANVGKRNSELALQQTERQISVELKKALLDLEAARKQYDASQKALVSATQDRRVAEERYNLGSGTLLDLQVANTNLLSAQVTAVNNSYNYLIQKKNWL